jgi:hypothetical protein
MHAYSIDIEERKNILLFLAIISIVLSWGLFRVLNNFRISLPWWFESPSVLFLYGLLFVFFDRWAWKFFRKLSLIKTPNLNGEWKGYLKSSFDDHAAQIKATLKVFQTWTKIKILLTTELSVSQSETASILTDTPEGKYLNYQYINEPIASAVKTMSIHRGTVKLLLNEKDSVFVGEYYCGRDRQNFGSLNFTKV